MAEIIGYTPPESQQTTPPEEMSKTPEQEIDLSNPQNYVSEFEKSIGFEDSLQKRIQEFIQENPSEVVTEEDKAQISDVIRTDRVYKNQLWAWQKEHPLPLNYNHLPREVTDSIHLYWQAVDSSRKAERRGWASQNEVINDDIDRSIKHFEAAKKLVEAGLAPNNTVGRLLVHFMSIEKGYDQPDPERDEKRLNFFR